MFLHIDPANGLAIYDQIVRQVKFAVAQGVLAAGDLAPSVRELARELAVNPNTVARAYAELARDGLIETRPGRGVFVAPRRRVFAAAEARRRLEPLLNSLISEATALGLGPDELKEALNRRR